MNDPRITSAWKQMRNDKRVELLLGAILDALLAPPPAANQEAKAPRKIKVADRVD